MARLYEYQGKQILRESGLPIPKGELASTPSQVREIAACTNGPVAIKAQVLSTGRFNAGGIKFAENPDDAERAARELLGIRINGFEVGTVLVEERLDIKQEFYAGIIVDDSYRVRSPLVMFSSKGGVNVEQVPAEHIFRRAINISQGLNADEALSLLAALGVQDDIRRSLAVIVTSLYNIFRRYDARSIEVNPLVLTNDGRLIAADCRISIDDASVWRHPELRIAVPHESDTLPTELDKLAWQIEKDDYRGVSFFAQLVPDTTSGGYIGFHAIGGGGALLAADALVRHGLKLANYADTSGNPTAAKVYRTAKIILAQPEIVGYCLIGAVIASHDQWHHAHGLLKAFRETLRDRPGFPVIILIAGNKEKESLEILREGLADLPIQVQLFGREYIYQLDQVAERMREMVSQYKPSRSETPITPQRTTIKEHELRFDFRTGSLAIDLDQCLGCPTLACVKACSLYGDYIFRVQQNLPVLGVPLEQVKRLCNECLACEYDCNQRGQGALQISLPTEGLTTARNPERVSND